MTRDKAGHAWLSLSLGVLRVHLSLCPITPITITIITFTMIRGKKSETHYPNLNFVLKPYTHSFGSRCCILCGEAGTGLRVLFRTDVFDSSAGASWVLDMCGVDHLLPPPCLPSSKSPEAADRRGSPRLLRPSRKEPVSRKSGFCYVIPRITALDARVPHKH